MNWGSAQEFFEMGGYWPYVWGSYLVTFAAIGIEVASLRARLASARSQPKENA